MSGLNFARLHVDIVCDADATRRTFTGIRSVMTVEDVMERHVAAMAWDHYNNPRPLPIHRTEAGYPHCSTCDGGGCPDCTDPA